MATDKDIMDAMADTLSADQTLAAYVKKVTVGELDTSRKLFPYIAVGNLQCSVSPWSMGKLGKDMLTYRLEIRAGAKGFAAPSAFAGEHGILQLCEDIVSACRPADFEVFDKPVSVEGVFPAYRRDTAGTVWTASITISGVRFAQRSA